MTTPIQLMVDPRIKIELSPADISSLHRGYSTNLIYSSPFNLDRSDLILWIEIHAIDKDAFLFSLQEIHILLTCVEMNDPLYATLQECRNMLLECTEAFRQMHLGIIDSPPRRI
jgi:hypothetical protein